MYDVPAYAELYTALPEVHVSRALPTTLTGVLERIQSKSYISLLDARTQRALLDEVEHMLASTPDEELGRRWIDREKGVWEYVSCSHLIWSAADVRGKGTAR